MLKAKGECWQGCQVQKAGFAQISSKQAFYYQTIFVSIKKGQKLATWIIHFIIGKKVSKKAEWQP